MFTRPSPAADTAPALALAQAQVGAQLRLLGELAEIGLNIARAVERQATGRLAEDEAPVTTGDVTAAYERVARAVGMTVALQSRLVDSLNGLEKAGIEARRQADGERRAGGFERRLLIGRIVDRVAWAAYRRDHEQDRAEALLETLRVNVSDWIADGSRSGDVLARPLSEIVASICRDLGLSPDWPRLAEEAWAREEMAGGAVGAPLAATMAEAELDAGAEPGARYRTRPLRRRAWNRIAERSG